MGECKRVSAACVLSQNIDRAAEYLRKCILLSVNADQVARLIDSKAANAGDIEDILQCVFLF